MSYTIYIGEPNAIESSNEIGSFSKDEHDSLFRHLRQSRLQYDWLSELEDYETFVNYTNTEVKNLLQEVQLLKSNDLLGNNSILNCLQLACERALLQHLQVMCVGE